MNEKCPVTAFRLTLIAATRNLTLAVIVTMTGPQGNSKFCFPRISMFPETKSRGKLRFEGNKIHCSPRDQFEKWAEISATTSDHL